MKQVKCPTILSPFLFLISFRVLYGFTQFEDNIKYAIKENEQSQIKIGKISEDVTTQTQSILKNMSDKINYRLQRQMSYFTLDPITSILKTKIAIDLEELCPIHCPTGEMGQLYLVVNVWEGLNLKGIIKVEINIQDVNDNAPTFLTSSVLKSVKEVIYGVGKSMELQKAIDRDVSKEHNFVVYKLDADKHADTFALKVTNDSFPILVLKKALDYERCKIYHLTIWAWNIPAGHHKTKLSVTIRVVNINDMEPKFRQQKYEISVEENLPINSMIIQVEAIDEDEDSEITYRATEFSSQFFSVSSKGQIFLKKQLDFESATQHYIDVQATDNEFIANTKVIINVSDVNDEAPQFNLNPSICRVEEGQPENLIIGQITIWDRDSANANGKLSCWEPRNLYNKQAVIFKPPLDSKHFNGKYDLHTRVQFDREETDDDIRKVIIVCHDGAEKNPLTSTMTISFTIADINDNLPLFDEPSYSAIIEENNVISAQVIKIMATDKDIGMNGKITYEIDSLHSPNSEKRLFVIDPETGWISVTQKLDREMESFYRLIIIAKDNGTVPKQLSSSCMVNITVSDINDNSPKFIGPNKLAILENQPPGTFVGNINAEDLDEGPNGQLVFKFLPNPYENFFHLSANGSLYSAKEFDRENLDHYCFDIEINDQGKPPQSITIGVCINIMDVNDNFPRLTFPDYDAKFSDSWINETAQKEIISVKMSVYEQTGFEIIKCEALDRDDGNNAVVIYKMKIEKDPGIFSIGQHNGNLILKRKLNRDSIGDYTIQIVAEDSGKPPKMQSRKILVKIQDIPKLEEQQKKQLTDYYSKNYRFQITIMISIASGILMLIFISTVLCIIKPCSNRPNNRGDYSSVGRQFLCDTKSSNLEMKNEQYLLTTNFDHDKPTYIPNIYHHDPTLQPQSIIPNPLHNVMYATNYSNSHYNQFYLPRSYPFSSDSNELKSTFSPIYENSNFQQYDTNTIPT